MHINTVQDIRNEFVRKFKAGEIVTNDTGSLSGADTIEIVGASFIADESSIFGKPSKEYIKNELAWYKGQSLNVNDIPGETPAIWKAVATPDGWINSNYGWMVYSLENGEQFNMVLQKLLDSPSSRQAIMIYTRPSMHLDWCQDGKRDFCCTNTVTYLIRDGKMDAIVSMRSNDSVFGYKCDQPWQQYVLEDLVYQYNMNNEGVDIEVGNIHWQVSSLHIYQRHFNLIEKYITENNL